MERIKKRYFKRKIALLTILVVANLILYSVLYFASRISNDQATVKQVSGLSFNSSRDKLQPVFSSLPRFYSTFNFEFESDFLPIDDNYNNIFQTGGGSKTLRVELMHPASLQVVIGYKDDPGLKVYPISGKVKANAWNHIKLTYSSDQKLYIKLNDEEGASVDDKKHDFAINDLVLGTGFDRQRAYSGLIKNANFKIAFNETNDLLFILGLISKNYLILVIFQILFLSTKYLRRQSIRVKESDGNNVLFGFLKTFSAIAFMILLTGILSFPLTGQRKWIPYLSLLIPAVALGMNYLKIKWFKKREFLIMTGLLSLVILLLGFLNYKNLSWFGISGVLIACCYLSVIPFMKYKYFSLISAGIFIFLFGINAIVSLNNYGIQDYSLTILMILIVVCAFSFSLFEQGRPSKWTKTNRIGIVILLAISAVLALRSDSLFLGSSELHWGYFTGVMQSIRSGGELLWSVPSQYGFLNILLPSILPWTSRNSFFIFQAFLFFICSFIIIKTVYICFKHKAVFILISLVALSLFFFADPAVIGPALYPSSSVMRFFWCYVLVYAILLEYHKRSILNGRIKWFVAGAYVFGALWSAESMLYCTAIYATYLLASAISIPRLKVKSNSAFKFLLMNISVVLFALITMNISYLAIAGHFPDWSLFFMYVLNYANGYGEFVIGPGGIYWAIIIALACIIFISARLYSTKKYSEWIIASVCFSTLWIVTSYFVGRAVTNNLTALLPLIFYVFIVMSSVLMDSKFLTYRLLLNAVFLPWIIVGVMGGIGNPQFIKTLQKFKFAENIDTKSFVPDKELGSILQSLGAKRGTRIAYYGDLYSNPVIPDGKGGYMDPVAGMPMPLTLLEEPISVNKRNIIMERFFAKLNEPVFLIHRKNENLGRFSNWKDFFEQKYIFRKTEIGNGKYEVFRVSTNKLRD